jgi:N-acetylneuraminic acid mutarotase
MFSAALLLRSPRRTACGRARFPNGRRPRFELLESRCVLSGAWVAQPDIAPMPTARAAPFVAAVDGMLYVAGGNVGAAGAVTTLERYDPATDTWATLAPMPGRRYQGGVAVLDSKIYILGGWNFPDSTIPTSTVQIYDTLTDTWSFGPNMPTLSGSGPTGVIDGKIYKHTAEHGFSSASRRFHVLDPVANTWTTLPSIPNDHSGGAAGVVGGKLYVVAGTDNGFSVGNHAQVHAFDPVANTWSTLTSGPTPRHGVAGGVLGDQLLIAGGAAGGPSLDVFEAYDPADDAWSPLPPMPVAVSAAGGAVIGDTFYVVGGADANGLTGALQAYTTAQAVQSVEIDVKPGSDSNPINLASNGVIPVALFGSEAFDVLQVDVSTVVFAGASAAHWAFEDVDGDGYLDLILHFRTQETNLLAVYEQLLLDDLADGELDSSTQQAQVSLTGQTVDGAFFEGFDTVDLFLSGKNLRSLLHDLRRR